MKPKNIYGEDKMLNYSKSYNRRCLKMQNSNIADLSQEALAIISEAESKITSVNGSKVILVAYTAQS